MTEKKTRGEIEGRKVKGERRRGQNLLLPLTRAHAHVHESARDIKVEESKRGEKIPRLMRTCTHDREERGEI